MDATITAHLERLAGELKVRGWHAKVRVEPGRTPCLHVRNPEAPRMNDDVVADTSAYRWTWGKDIGPLSETAAVADRVMYVLRTNGM
ncbi:MULTISPECIES: hypothetical protein [Actinomadura]|uniref:Uncharacterized protein n=1 Tax=Actinomadura litoris TaxID=2678616 RepID=A0A7K1KTL3_9ACTN|nr:MULTISPECIES: hypothetical protein [Actinomadura]MBT2207883.1 hypothetical protein [Actinomadura sp. NEAU-AAG7]MUN35266.1 hypothetical protein [Actinomadura litoris]